MADWLLEFLSEEVPAGMQERAARNLEHLLAEALLGLGLKFSGLTTYVTPRRLVAHVTGLPVQQPDRCEERMGPRLDAPEKAVQGFLRANGLSDGTQAEQRLSRMRFIILRSKIMWVAM